VRDVLDVVADRLAAGETVAVGTVVATWRSAPRQPGAAMVVTADGEVVGSVSGGCVEGAVYEIAAEVRDGAPARLERFGVSDDDAFVVGLTCGGIIDVFVEAVSARTLPELAEVTASVRGRVPVALATVVAGPGPVGAHLAVWADRSAGTLGSRRLDEAVADDARGLLAAGRTATLRYGPDGERRGDELAVFV
jgi:xanthine dehydrogenase accessory factor